MAVRKRGRAVPNVTQTKKRSCDKKIKFYDRVDAEHHVDYLVARGTGANQVKVYRCKFSEHYHVGHTPGNQTRR